MSTLLERSTWIAGLALLCLGMGLGGCDAFIKDLPEPDKDEVYCDVQTVPCAVTVYMQGCIGVGECDESLMPDPGGGSFCIVDEQCTFPIGCDAVFCDGELVDPATVFDWSTCPTATASAFAVGDKACFEHTNETPQEACQRECEYLNPIAWPLGGRTVCTTSINTNHEGLNLEGYVELGCVDPRPDPFPFASQGTETVTLKGTGQVIVDGDAKQVDLTGGYFNFAAPYTDCNVLESTCPVQFNQARVEFDDFTFNGYSITGLYLELDEQTISPSGETVLLFEDPYFLFTIPQGVIFDSIGYIDGKKVGVTLTSSRELSASLNLRTGEVTFEFDVTGTIDDVPFEAKGAALTASVLARAPELSVESIEPEYLTDSCAAEVVLRASATSAAGLPVTIDYIVDGELVGHGESATATLSIGDQHEIFIVATDTNGMFDRYYRAVTPSDVLGPTVVLEPPVEIWPPNHEYVTVSLDDCVKSITDQCDGTLLSEAYITSVTSDEDADARGDGNTEDDFVIVDDQTVKLRAERTGTGDGRTYSIQFAVVDSHHNTTDASCVVNVEHNR